MLVSRLGSKKDLQHTVTRVDITVNGIDFVLEETNQGRLAITVKGGGNINISPCVKNKIEITGEEW